ncbi:hypothetical protein LTR36_002628 [Oleoguttula mirabilis]|uniref:Uncharacterized protein n=1 Tax=Oleoguttula mirabilis TaxID=1507867 RepID=A0AAV9JKA6_9PEZI|nr:hypothetical protein LTR36_002628 [Oleoguttula mirabilis]
MDRRPPQLNEVVCRCRIGCACAASRDGGEGGVDGGGHLAGVSLALPPSAGDDGSDDGASVNGDEGPAEHKIEVGDFGLVSLKAIHQALAKHQRCTCHRGILPETDDYPFSALNSPAASGILLGDSMTAQLSGDERNMSSSLALSTRSGGSSQNGAIGRFSPSAFLGLMGEHFDFEVPHANTPPLSYFHSTPIWLGHERGYCFNMDIGVSYGMLYPPELSIGDSAALVDHSEYDMW